MTLVVTVLGQRSIWLMADRRLTFGNGGVRDDACKIMALETTVAGQTEAVAILGYAGLGSTAVGTEPSEWMASVLRGRNWPFLPSLDALYGAMRREIVPHLATLPGVGVRQHNIVCSAIWNGEPQLYSMNAALAPDDPAGRFGGAHHKMTRRDGNLATPRIAMAGSGARLVDPVQRREIVRLVRAYDDEKISAEAVARSFAAVNHRVARSLSSVGPNSIVFWRNGRERGRSARIGGGAHCAFSGLVRDRDMPPVPVIAAGVHLGEFLGGIAPEQMRVLRELRAGNKAAKTDAKAMNEALAALPKDPDERLK